MTRDGQSFLDVDFDYVVDPKLRAILEVFHAEARDAFNHRHHVSSVILAGAILEGLLTFALERRGAEAREEYRKALEASTRSRPLGRTPQIRDWRLEELINIASRLQLIGMTSSEIAPAVRDFRNFIHPYRLTRRSKQRWDALAAMALSAFAQISHSLSGRIRR